MLTISEEKWRVLTPVSGEVRLITVEVHAPLTQYQALRLAKALELASDHLVETP